MNNIVESYLLFKANNVCKYINILAEDKRILSKIPKQLNKLIYKYYDLFVLSNREVDYELLCMKTGLDVSKDKICLFYLLIEFDMASKSEYKNNDLYQLYDFIVNSILVFLELEREKTINSELSYEDLIQRVLKKYLEYVNDDYMILVDKLHVLLCKEYNSSLKKEIKFRENYNSDVYDVYFSKVKKSDNLYLSKFRYKNDKLYEESKNDVLLINTEFLLELDLVNIDMLSMKMFDYANAFDNRCVFVRIDDSMFIKKSNLGILMNMFDLRFLKEKLIIVVNTGMLEKNEEKINYLIQNGFNISYLKNSELTSYDIYKNGGYLFVMVDENVKPCLKFAKDNGLNVIVSKGNKKSMEKLNNVMYVS